MRTPIGPHVSTGAEDVVGHSSKLGGPCPPRPLRATPLFARLGDEAAEELESSMSVTTLYRGQTLFRQGDTARRIFVVVSGKIKLCHYSGVARENLLTVGGAGELLGEASLFDRGPSMATATAVTDVEVKFVERDNLYDLLQRYPEVAFALLAWLAGRIRTSQDVLADMASMDVGGRLSKALLDLMSRFGHAAKDGWHVEHDLTQEELSQLVGASRETVNRTLVRFEARGWVRLGSREFVVVDPGALRRVGSRKKVSGSPSGISPRAES